MIPIVPMPAETSKRHRTVARLSRWLPADVKPLLLLFLACLVMAGPHVWPLNGISDFGYDSLDASIFLWDFWWTKISLLQFHSPYWTDHLLYPGGAALSFHSYPMPYSLASLLVQWIVPGPDGLAVAYNLIVFFSFLLSSYGAYRLARHVTGSPAGALVAGLIFAYTPFRFLNVPRLHLLATEFLAFYVFALVRFVEAPSRRRAVVLGLLLGLTYHTSLEYALYLVLFSVLWLALEAKRIRNELRATVVGLTRAALVFLLVASPLIWSQVHDLSRGLVDPVRPLDEARSWGPALISFALPSRFHPLYGDALLFLGEYGVHDESVRSEASLGVVALAIAAIALFRLRRDGSGAWLVALLVFAVLALGPTLRLTSSWQTGLSLPYRALYELLPPLRAGRDPTRLLPLATLCLSVLAAFGTRALLERRWRPRTGTVLASVLGGLVLFESCTRWPHLVEAHAMVPSPCTDLARSSPASAVIDLSPEPLAILCQTQHGLPITLGRRSVARASRSTPPLEVEKHLRNPETVLSLDGPALARQLHADREALRLLGIRSILVPARSATDAQKHFFGLIASRIDVREGLIVVEPGSGANGDARIPTH